MGEPFTILTLASSGLLGLTITAFAVLKGWQGWLELKRLELARGRQDPRSPTMDMIDMADLKERVRKLEAIASCVDL